MKKKKKKSLPGWEDSGGNDPLSKQPQTFFYFFFFGESIKKLTRQMKSQETSLMSARKSDVRTGAGQMGGSWAQLLPPNGWTQALFTDGVRERKELSSQVWKERGKKFSRLHGIWCRVKFLSSYTTAVSLLIAVADRRPRQPLSGRLRTDAGEASVRLGWAELREHLRAAEGALQR